MSEYNTLNQIGLNKDYLIVGQGIAGTILAHFLLKKNKDILIVDEFNPSSSTNVAAGLFNPITGRKHIKSWMADTIFPFAEQTYTELEEFLQTQFYHPINTLKLFSSVQEKNDWRIRSELNDSDEFIIKSYETFIEKSFHSFQYGGIEISKTGYVDMSHLLEAFKIKMQHDDLIIEKSLKYNELLIQDNYVLWDKYKFKKVIFCEGYMATMNPYFSWLPFVLAKGEVLTIYSEELQLNKIVNKGIFILPLGNNKYRVGSTYEWNFKDTNPSQEGFKELKGKLDLCIDCNYKIMDHRAGIRPTVKDRRPFIGIHPVNNKFGIFNGLGTKGATLAPYFANQFVEYLEEGKPLLKEVNILRYYKP